MPYAPTTSVFPSERRSLGIAKELVAGTGVMPASTIPVKGFVPEDKPIWLPDESLRSAMAKTYGLIQGPYVADITIESSPVYGDQIGHILYNVLGDYVNSGTTATPTTTLNGGVAAGATSITLTSGTGVTANMWMQVGATGTTSCEIVQILSIAGSPTFTLVSPLRFAHLTAVAVTHIFSLLNGTGNAQPPAHTITDQSYINADLARWYPYSCFSEISLTGNAEQLFLWAGKAMGFANVHPASPPVVNVSGIPAQPSWNSTVGLGGTVATAPIYQIAEYEVVIAREVQPYFTANGQQNPFVIGRGSAASTGKMAFSPTIDESPLLDMLNNSQPQFQAIQTNGLAGAAKVSMQIDIQVCAFNASVIEPGKALLGYSNTFEAIANTVNVGNSAGYSPIMVTLINSVQSY
jgi:hypothetical protein